jgi:transcriptional regulator with XRE-family HTH domain
MDVGRVLREARWSKEWSQRQLARRVGVTASALSRYETGAQLPSLRLVERVLEECDRDLQLTLVERHVDLAAELAALAAAPYVGRLPRRLLSLPYFLRGVAGLSCPVHVGGRWAAALHGLPTEPADAVLTLVDDEPSAEAVAALLLSRYAQIEEEGGFFGLMIRAATVRRGPRTRWYVPDVGTLTTVLVPTDADLPDGVAVQTDDGELCITPADALTEADGVRADVLEVWRRWRTGRVAADVPWEPPLD